MEKSAPTTKPSLPTIPISSKEKSPVPQQTSNARPPGVQAALKAANLRQALCRERLNTQFSKSYLGAIEEKRRSTYNSFSRPAISSFMHSAPLGHYIKKHLGQSNDEIHMGLSQVQKVFRDLSEAEIPKPVGVASIGISTALRSVQIPIHRNKLPMRRERGQSAFHEWYLGVPAARTLLCSGNSNISVPLMFSDLSFPPHKGGGAETRKSEQLRALTTAAFWC